MVNRKWLSYVSFFAIASGIIVALGWWLGAEALVSVLPGYVTMKMNVAVGFVIAGITFYLLLRQGSPALVATLGFVLFCTGLATLLQTALHTNWGIDELLVRDNAYDPVKNPYPGRMAGATAICFTLMGMAFMLLQTKRLREPGQYLLHLVTLISFIALLGYVYGVLVKLVLFSSMAVHTAFIMLVLSIGISCAYPRLGVARLFFDDRLGSRMARGLVPRLLGYVREETERYHLVDAQFGIALYTIAFVIVGLLLIWNTAGLMDRIDLQRKKAEDDLLFVNRNLEQLVAQKTAELSLLLKKTNEANANLRAIFNSAQVSVISTDTSGMITNFNKGAERLLGYSAREMNGRRTPEAIHVPEEVQARGEALSAMYGREIKGFDVFVEEARHGMFVPRQWTYVRSDGSTFPVQLVVSSITDEQGVITGFLGIATDISDLQEARSSLESLVEGLQRKNDQLVSFSHIISHNLRSPVGSLNSLFQLYKKAGSDEERERMVEFMELGLQSINETLGTLVDSLKVREANVRDVEELTFEEVFTKTREIFTGTIMELNAVVTADFAAPTITYSRSYLESIMLNLLSNALKYHSPERQPVIHFATHKEKSGTALTVADNGLGIDMKLYGDRLFGLNKTFHQHPEAKGVGLFMTKTQIEAMGGRISATSELGKGTEFTIHFNR